MIDESFTPLLPTCVEEAFERIASYIHYTPLMTSDRLNQWLGHEIIFKPELFQLTGAFKTRGAMNKLLALKEQGQLPNHVCAFSSGNHAQAVAHAATTFGVGSTIFFAKNASLIKIQATRAYGANVVIAETRQDAEQQTAQLVRDGATLVHAYSDDDVIAGQGTACLEALKELETMPPDAIFVPCGGGGLTSGTLLAKNHLSPSSKLFSVEPAIANDAARSFRSGKIVRFDQSPTTLADGARTLSLSPRTFHYIQQVDDFFEVTEEQMVYWTQWLTHLLKLTVEPTSALPMAAAYEWLKTQTSRQRVLIILTGGNMDIAAKQTVWQDNWLEKIPGR